MNKIGYYKEIEKKYDMANNKRNLIVIGSPNHGNLGDIAITYATLELLKSLYPDDNVFDITMDEFPFEKDAIYNAIKPQDIIILQGGGNFGNIYPDDEMIRRCVISGFKNNKIIMFPQSVYFSPDENGKKELEISSKLYGENKNLYLLARDKDSLNIIRKNFNASCELLPDVVLTKKLKTEAVKKGALVCLRKDTEGILSDEDKKAIEHETEKIFDKITATDTVIDFDGNKEERYGKLIDKIKEFQNAELVVTDRLHGLIFSIITNTPCVVLPVVNTKITSMLETLGNSIKGISLIKSVNELTDAMLNIKNCTDIEYDNTAVLEQYRDTLNKILEKPIIEVQKTDNIFDKFELASYWDYKAYESEYWKNNIAMEYDKLQKNNEERIKELEIYKEWVGNLEKQKEELHKNYELSEQKKNELSVEYDNLNKNIETRINELTEYKTWVTNLQNQNNEMKKDYHTLEENHKERIKEVESYKKWVSDLEKTCEDVKQELRQSQKDCVEIDAQLKASVNEINRLRDEEAVRQKQFNIQLRELYANVKQEREDKAELTSEYDETIKNLQRNLDEKENVLQDLIRQLEEERKNNSTINRGVLYKTIRCLKLYGIKHTIKSCVREMKKKTD